MNNAEALPCAHCGGKCDPEGWLDGKGMCGPECEDCGATTRTLADWNRRNHLTDPGYVRVPLRPEPERIDAGAQRLVSWDVGCTWPDSWDPMQVAAAKQDAERVYLEMVNYKETSHD